MNKREKILVSAMTLAVLYGMYAFFIEPKGNSNSKVSDKRDAAGMNKIMETVMSDINKKAITEIEHYILKKADTEWINDPFANRRFFIKTANETELNGEDKEEIVFDYTGYLNMGDKEVVIINDNEFLKGEIVEGYILRKIEQARVVLEDIGTKKTRVIKFKDEIFEN